MSFSLLVELFKLGTEVIMSELFERFFIELNTTALDREHLGQESPEPFLVQMNRTAPGPAAGRCGWCGSATSTAAVAVSTGSAALFHYVHQFRMGWRCAIAVQPNRPAAVPCFTL